MAYTADAIAVTAARTHAVGASIAFLANPRFSTMGVLNPTRAIAKGLNMMNDDALGIRAVFVRSLIGARSGFLRSPW